MVERRRVGRRWCRPLVLVCILLSLHVQAADKLVRQDWWLLQSPHFSVITNNRGDVPETIIGDLELFRSVVLALTGRKTVEEKLPTTAVVFKSAAEFNRLTRRPNIAGYMRPTLRGNWMVSGGGTMSLDQRQIMFHEYVHHLLRSASTVNYASWYDEGLADMLSSVYEADGRVVIGAEAPARIRTLKNNSMQVSLEKIVNTDDLSDWHRYHVSYFYAMSWALVNYLNVGHLLGTPSRVGELQQYLALTQQGVDRAGAFNEAFGLSPGQMEDKVNDYLGIRMRPVLMVPRDRFPMVDDISRRKLDAAEISYQLAMLAMYSNSKLSRALLEDQLAGNAGNPRLTGALAITYQIAGEFQKGAELARQSAQDDPNDAVLAIDLADLLVAWNRDACQSASEACAERIIEAEQHYERALNLTPGNPEAHAQLAALQLGEMRDLEAAAEHVEVALGFQPWSPNLNLLAGQIYLNLDVPGPAREHLQRALHWSERESVRAAAARALQNLDERAGGRRENEGPEDLRPADPISFSGPPSS